MNDNGDCDDDDDDNKDDKRRNGKKSERVDDDTLQNAWFSLHFSFRLFSRAIRLVSTFAFKKAKIYSIDSFS